jgi:hypothetical protein
MNLQEHIRKVLREESKLPARLLRRLSNIDDLIPFKVKHYYKPDSICPYENAEEFVQVVMYSVIDTMYYDHFGDIDDDSKEWMIMHKTMEKYIKDNYGDKLKEYYHINCGKLK